MLWKQVHDPVHFTFRFRWLTRFCHQQSQCRRPSGPTVRSASCAAWASRALSNSFSRCSARGPLVQFRDMFGQCQCIQSMIQQLCRRSRRQPHGNVPPLKQNSRGAPAVSHEYGNCCCAGIVGPSVSGRVGETQTESFSPSNPNTNRSSRGSQAEYVVRDVCNLEINVRSLSPCFTCQVNVSHGEIVRCLVHHVASILCSFFDGDSFANSGRQMRSSAPPSTSNVPAGPLGVVTAAKHQLDASTSIVSPSTSLQCTDLTPSSSAS